MGSDVDKISNFSEVNAMNKNVLRSDQKVNKGNTREAQGQGK